MADDPAEAQEPTSKKVEENNVEEDSRLKWHCNRCGMCCRNFIQPIQEPLSEDAKKYFEGFKNKIVIDDHHICFKEKCKHLQQRNGKYFCDAYEDRPQFCRSFGETECKVLHILKKRGVIS